MTVLPTVDNTSAECEQLVPKCCHRTTMLSPTFENLVVHVHSLEKGSRIHTERIVSFIGLAEPISRVVVNLDIHTRPCPLDGISHSQSVEDLGFFFSCQLQSA